MAEIGDTIEYAGMARRLGEEGLVEIEGRFRVLDHADAGKALVDVRVGDAIGEEQADLHTYVVTDEQLADNA